jgi:hypothetical protein
MDIVYVQKSPLLLSNATAGKEASTTTNAMETTLIGPTNLLALKSLPPTNHACPIRNSTIRHIPFPERSHRI